MWFFTPKINNFNVIGGKGAWVQTLGVVRPVEFLNVPIQQKRPGKGRKTIIQNISVVQHAYFSISSSLFKQERNYRF